MSEKYINSSRVLLLSHCEWYLQWYLRLDTRDFEGCNFETRVLWMLCNADVSPERSDLNFTTKKSKIKYRQGM
jgi:hypothetical protein